MSDLNCIKQNNKPSLRALAKQSSAGFKLKIDLDCFTTFAKTILKLFFEHTCGCPEMTIPMMLRRLKPYRLNFFLALSITLLLPTAARADFPRGCEVSGFGFDDPYVIFNDTDQQTFFLIENHTDFPLQLERVETEDTFMSPKLESKLNPARWSAFASDISNVHFQCFTRTEGSPALINCREALTICQYPRVKFALSNKGSYWVSTNKPQKKVIHDAATKGILLRW